MTLNVMKARDISWRVVGPEGASQARRNKGIAGNPAQDMSNETQGEFAMTAQGETKMKMTDARRFCLEYLAKGESCTRDVCKAAREANVMQTWRTSYEWADKHFLALRNAGLIEKTGERSAPYGRAIHRITDAGRAALADTPT